MFTYRVKNEYESELFVWDAHLGLSSTDVVYQSPTTNVRMSHFVLINLRSSRM
ncbi:hypothetical protein M378DRAFT_172779 [Amanita muscaria Koide BX008]|uniref:Uncharacterized protein n=1 Tax=Amanita muscaria (strain Koide BX008) TaxID=946122 RepID=A0A0C2SQX1_AMAMK|nr:hypothetical protein M378DRAFT_172779 [Amanita muscaria Koide BX008]